MTPEIRAASTEFNPEKFFKDNALVVVIDDKGGDGSSVGELTKALCAKWARSSVFFHVKNIEGQNAEEKIEDFRQKLETVIAPGSDNHIIFVLDRDLGIGNLPLSPEAQKSLAADIDKYNDGPALVPHIKKWYNNPPIVGFTGEGDITGMTELYGGARVIQKPDYQSLKTNLVEAFAEAYTPLLKLESEKLPTAIPSS